MRGKNLTKRQGGYNNKTKIRYLIVAMGLLLSSLMIRQTVQATGCPNLRIVFARGSGGERWTDQNYLAYKDAIESKLQNVANLNYEFIDLDYPAIGIGNPSVLLGAYFGAGEAYEFGESVKTGISNLATLINSAACPNTRYVLGGYSQGAMVISGALSNLQPHKIIYAATFGDPKIYLPEGHGLLPAACRGDNLSDYRMYVPDCQAYKGMLGANMPYEPDALNGKVGTWCNKRDIFCSSKHWDLLAGVSDHTAYISDDLYEDASKVIVDRICQAFSIKNAVSSSHDTAILIDSTRSMSKMIKKYKAEALRLAEQTLNSGGRVALYDYRDLIDCYDPVKHCDFDTCTLELFQSELDNIRSDAGGDTPESLLSASFHVMKDLKWKQGSTKSLVILTDADFLSPDRDGMSFDAVVKLSKQIDPVNFYIITNPDYGEFYAPLALATDGAVVTNFDELNLLTDFIMERYDSLPRVEEDEIVELPALTVEDVVVTGSEATIRYSANGTQAIVSLNDAVLGMTTEREFTIQDLRPGSSSKLALTPIDGDIRGESVEIELNIPAEPSLPESTQGSNNIDVQLVITSKPYVSASTLETAPKAPNTGRK